MAEKTKTTTKEEKIYVCDFCGDEIRFTGLCGRCTGDTCDICNKHICRAKCATVIEVEGDCGGDYYDGVEVSLCPDHATDEVINRVKGYKKARDEMEDRHYNELGKLKKEFGKWLKSKSEEKEEE